MYVLEKLTRASWVTLHMGAAIPGTDITASLKEKARWAPAQLFSSFWQQIQCDLMLFASSQLS